MPWIGVVDGERVAPEQVSDGAEVTCPSCGEGMYPRGPTVDGKARHFTHTAAASATDRTCSGTEDGGESDTHRRMKSQVVSALTQWFAEKGLDVTPEVTIEVSGSASSVETRQADVLAEFSPPHPVFGSDLVVEVQYRNHAKPVNAVTHDYIVAGCSVYWASEDVFTPDRFLIGELIAAFNRPDTPRYDSVDGSVPAAVVAETTSPLNFNPIPPGELDTEKCIGTSSGAEASSAGTETDQGREGDDIATISGDESVSISQGSTEPTTIPGTNPKATPDKPEFQLPETVSGDGFGIKYYFKYEDYPDVCLTSADEQAGWSYANLPAHPPVTVLDEVARTTRDGHPIPHLPDCDHEFSSKKEFRSLETNPVECLKCSVITYRVPDIEVTPQHDVWDVKTPYREYIAEPYESLPTPALYFDGDAVTGDPDSDYRDFAPYCGDRIWLVNRETDTYQCTTCGRRFPQSTSALRDQYGDAADTEGG